MSSISQALQQVEKHWTCSICGQEYTTQRKAVECADQHLTENQTRTKINEAQA